LRRLELSAQPFYDGQKEVLPRLDRARLLRAAADGGRNNMTDGSGPMAVLLCTKRNLKRFFEPSVDPDLGLL